MVTEPATLPQAREPKCFGPTLKASTGHSTFTGAVEVDEWIDITIQDAQDTVSTFEGKETPQIVWLISLDGQEDKGVVAYYTTYSTYDGGGKQPEPSKLFSLFRCIGLELPIGSQIDVAPALGKKLRAMFEIKKGKRFATIARIRAVKE